MKPSEEVEHQFFVNAAILAGFSDGQTQFLWDWLASPKSSLNAQAPKEECCDRCKDYDPCYKIGCQCHKPVSEKIVVHCRDAEEIRKADEKDEHCISHKCKHCGITWSF